MFRFMPILSLSVAGLAGLPGLVHSQQPQPQRQVQQPQRIDEGRLEYEAHCAVCHGTSGRGNGELRRFLTVQPSDLTTIAKRNGGAFPTQLMWDVIDGRSEIGAHGGRSMPAWGQRYRLEAMQQAVTATQPEWYVRNRIVALLDYLSRIQEK